MGEGKTYTLTLYREDGDNPDRVTIILGDSEKTELARGTIDVGMLHQMKPGRSVSLTTVLESR